MTNRINEFGTVGTHPEPDPIPVQQNEELVSKLNGLIETTRDGQEGFKQAAEGIEDADLKSFFYELSQQRAAFTGELQDLVRTLGSDPENAGSVSGAIHRGWMNIKSAVTGNSEAAILAECERGEDTAKAEYQKVLETELPAYVLQTVQQQYGAVLQSHDRVKALRDAAKGERSSSARTGF